MGETSMPGGRGKAGAGRYHCACVTETVNIQQVLAEGAEHHRRGELAQAEQCYRRVLAEEPNHPDALHLLGMLADQVGRHEDAVRILQRAVQLSPRDAGYLNTLGIALQQAQRTDEAAVAFERATNAAPEFLEPAMRLGGMLKEQNKLMEAIAVLERTVKGHPRSADARFMLGETVDRWGDRPWAIEMYRGVVEIDPKHAPAWNNLGRLLERDNLIDEAAECYQRVCELDERLGEAKAKLEQLRKGRGIEQEAELHFPVETEPVAEPAREASAGAPAAVEPLTFDFAHEEAQLAGQLEAQGRIEEAVAAYRRAVELDLMDAALHSRLLVALNYLPDVDVEQVYQEHVGWAAGHGSMPTLMHPGDRDVKKKRLRVGYVSGDFRDNALGRSIEPLLKGHDRKKFEIVCYSNNPHDDEATARMRKLASAWHDIAATFDDRVARQVFADEIDILVDLSGHSARNRLGVFAHKPTPIQATYLGYPNTTGLTQIDWRISDALIDPEKGARRKQPYAEPGVARVGCAWSFVEPPDAPEVGPVPRVTNGYATFGCFAKLAKINGKVLDPWGQILRKLLDARMVIKSDGLEDEAARARMAGEFEARGIRADRVELLGRSESRREHLAAYAKIDVALDTLPWNGTGRTFEALYMGVPVMTMFGDLEAGRAGASLLRALRLHDLIGKDAAEYVNKAVALAVNETRLKTLRKTLRQRVQKSRLVDGKKLAREMEKIYRAMWRAYCEPESGASASAGAEEGEDARDDEQAGGGAA